MISTEQRHEQRVAVDFWVELRRGDELYLQRATNLSASGIYFGQTIPLPQGSRVSLKFSLAPGESAIESQGEVVNVKSLGMGVHFADVASAQRQRLQAWIAASSKHPPSEAVDVVF
jgi:PilZ domain